MWQSRWRMRWRRSSSLWCARMRNCCAPSSTHSSPQPGASPGSQRLPAAPAGPHLPHRADPAGDSPGPPGCAHSTIPAPKLGPGNAHPQTAPATRHHTQWEQKGGVVRDLRHTAHHVLISIVIMCRNVSDRTAPKIPKSPSAEVVERPCCWCPSKELARKFVPLTRLAPIPGRRGKSPRAISHRHGDIVHGQRSPALRPPVHQTGSHKPAQRR
jgi:hypothetical protein